MPTTICPNCQRRGTVVAYLAHLPVLCTGCGHSLEVLSEASIDPPQSQAEIDLASLLPEQPSDSEKSSQPSITVSHEPKLLPLVLSPSSPLSSPIPPIALEDNMSPNRLANYLKELGTLPPPSPSSEPSTQQSPAAVRPSLPEPPGIWPSSKLRRLLARLLQIAMVALVVLASPLWANALGRLGVIREATSPILWVAAVYAPAIVFVLLNLILLELRGQDFGKLLFGIKIVKETGTNAGMWSGFLKRELPFYLAIPAILFAGMALAAALHVPYLVLPCYVFALVLLILDPVFIFTEAEQCLHDHLAKTRVVEVE